MTGRIFAVILTLTFLAGLTGCQTAKLPADAALTRVTYDRGHGSVWGIQFYIDLTETEIVKTHFFRSGEGELTEASAIPITAEQWERVEQSLLSLAPSLTAKKGGKMGFFKKQKLDGAESRTLTLTWKIDNKQQTLSYDWPSSEEAAKLETLLETLAQNTIKE